MKTYDPDNTKPMHLLPVWDHQRLQLEIKKNRKIIVVIYGIAHDVTHFMLKRKHPGGRTILLQNNGKDCTEAFNGVIHDHSNEARILASHMRVAKIAHNGKKGN